MPCRPLLIFLAMGTLSLGLAGCGAGENKRKAEETADQFYSTLAKKDWDKALSFYDPNFFQKTSKKEWRQTLIDLEKQLGAYESHLFQSWQYRSRVGSGGSQQVTVLTYRVKYANAETTETIMFARSGDEELKIVGHKINSSALTAPKQAAPKQTTPNFMTPHLTEPKQSAPKQTKPKQTAPRK